jgi:hypothetical protein
LPSSNAPASQKPSSVRATTADDGSRQTKPPQHQARWFRIAT